MAPTKLTYFNGKGLAEPIRFLLSYSGEEFIDHRVDYAKEWATLKPSIPFGKLPLLEFDGKVHSQSLAICRYLGKKNNIAGKDDYEALKIDTIVDVIGDLRTALSSYSYDTNDESKEKKYKVLVDTTIPFYMSSLDKEVKNNQGYFVNGKLTWADLYFVAVFEYMNVVAKFDMIEKYPNLVELKKKILAIPSIKAWVDKRPASEF